MECRAQHGKSNVDGYECRLLAKPPHYGHRGCHSHHVGHLAHGEEQSGIERYHHRGERYYGSAAHNVVEIICHRGSAHRAEKVEREGCHDENPPRTVVQERLEVGSHRRLRHGVQMFAREAEAQQKQHQAAHCHHHHSKEPAPRRMVAAEHIGERLPEEHGKERTLIGKEHTERREHRLLAAVGSHHAEHCTVGHVDAGVHRHHEQIGGVGPHELGGIAEVGGCEEQDAAHREERSHPEQIRAVFSPTGVGAVGNDAHHRVAHGIPDAGDEQDDSGIHKRQSEDVAVEER